MNDDVLEAVRAFDGLGGSATVRLGSTGCALIEYDVSFFQEARSAGIKPDMLDYAILWAVENAGYMVPLELTHACVHNGNAFFVTHTDTKEGYISISRPFGVYRDGTRITSMGKPETRRQLALESHAAFLVAAAKATVQSSRKANRPRHRPSTDAPPDREIVVHPLALQLLCDDDEDDRDACYVPRQIRT